MREYLLFLGKDCRTETFASCKDRNASTLNCEEEGEVSIGVSARRQRQQPAH